MKDTTKIAIFTGSFKPPHIGHFTLVKNLLAKIPDLDKVYIIISPKPRDNITAEQSEKIWHIYKKYLPNSDKVIITPTFSSNKSPVITGFKIAKSLEKKKDATLYLIKSQKDEANKRFDIFDSLKKIKIHKLILPTFTTINSTQMREAIKMKAFSKIDKYFLPKELDRKDKADVKIILSS